MKLQKIFLKKRGDTNIDFDGFFRGKIENMLVTASWVEKIREMLGLKAVSQVWGEKPAWYFWILGASGVYQLQLESASTDVLGSKDVVSGIFSVKCYPFPQEEVFQTFSFEEQCFIQSNFFDRTNTPRIELKEKIPETLFNIATMEYTVDLDDTFALFTFESLDAMRVCYNQEMLQEYPVLKKSKRFSCGEIGRDVPGWDLGYQFFDRLLSLYSFYSKRKPARIIMTSSPGFEYVYDGSNSFQCLDTDNAKIYSLTVFSAIKDGETGRNSENLIAEQIKSEYQDLIYDQTFESGYCSHNHDQHSSMPVLNDLWWSLADANYKSELASSCGCE